MRAYDLILKKRNGLTLSDQEISALINGYMSGEVADYQIAAFLMAIFFKGMEPDEIASLTKAIVDSGDTINMSLIPGIKVDKHSTGGVGDKTTLVLGPLVASTGLPVAKMSGRGLGHTGGTIDKLESISGFNTALDKDVFMDSVKQIGIAISGQTGNLAPADKKLYALRDVTATVDSIPLIASSVMSKKIAAGADAIVLDVKVGSGAFMKTTEEAMGLARTMVKIGHNLGRKTVAVITGMDEPLGNTVGNALEVKEAILSLKGEGPKDLEELCIALGSHMLVLGGKAETIESARLNLLEMIKTGKALDKFREMVIHQGGDANCLEHPELLPTASHTKSVLATSKGYVHHIQSEQIGIAAMVLGAGRETKESVIDLAVGIELHKKVGDSVTAGEAIATIHYNDENKFERARNMIENAYEIKNLAVDKPKLIQGIVDIHHEEFY